MNNDDRYLLSDLTITDQYIEKFKCFYVLPVGQSDVDLRENIRSYLKICLGSVFTTVDQILDVSFRSIKSKLKSYSGDPLCAESLFHYRHFHEFYVNALNNWLKFIVGEIPSPEILAKEINTELNACLINWISVNREYLADTVINNKKPNELLQVHNAVFFKIKNNESLLNKLQSGENNAYLKFLPTSIEYLKVKTLDAKPNDAYTTLCNNQKEETHYILPENQIVGLHKIFNDVVIQNMNCADFMICFDMNKKPNKTPTYVKRQQNLMTYALSLIVGIDAKTVLSHFNIKNYYQMKTRNLPPSKRPIQNQIKRIFENPSINVSLK